MNATLPDDVAELLSQFIFKFSKKDVLTYFARTGFEENVLIKFEDLLHFDSFLTEKIDKIKNVGIDFPILFQNKGKPNLVIVAMDPKRNDNNQIQKGNVSLGSVFSLNNINSTKQNSNDYWKFISPLRNDFNIYLTDIYKIYFASSRSEQKVSNKDFEFKNKSTSIDNQNVSIHKQILKKELEIVFRNSNSEDNLVVALGKEAEIALREIYNISFEEENIQVTQENINFLFMPHISRTVTQSIKTIGSLYEAIGVLKNLRKLYKKGNEFKEIGGKIKELKSDLFL
jgi:hypothetical protein